MKNITILALIFLGTVLNSAMFDNNTDVKSKYQFDVNTALENEKLAKKLARFKNDKVTEAEIKRYTEARDDNKSAPFEEDVALDESLKNSFPQREIEKAWYISVYDYMFDDAKEKTPAVEEEAPAVEEEIPVAQEVTEQTNPEQGVQ